MLEVSPVNDIRPPNSAFVIVTGGAGYIGSHTCLELLHKGYNVIVIDNFSNSNRKSLQKVAQISGKSLYVHEIDVTDYPSFSEVVESYKGHEILAIIHFAGLKAVGESTKNPLEYYRENITGTLNILDIMKNFRIKRLIFSSSATVYGNCSTIPIHEECPLSALSPYGSTKIFNEQIITDVMTQVGGSAITLRYFNPIGAHPSGEIGEDPHGSPNNLMPYMAQVAVGKRTHIDIYGTDYDTPDGTGIRDYIHVMDLARGHILALETLDSVQPGENRKYNLGMGKGHSVLEMINSFSKAVGTHIPYKLTSRRSGDVAVLVADPSKAEKELGFKCQYSVDDMCQDLWRWQSKHPNGYNKL